MVERTPVRSRIVLFVPGFEPLPTVAQRDRFARTLARTAGLWSLEAAVGPLAPGGADTMPSFAASARGADWRCAAEIRLLAWDDLIAGELARGWPALVRRGGAAVAAVLLDGTVARYAAAHWRYALFALAALLPFLGIAAALLFAGFGVGAGAPWSLLPATLSLLLAALAAWRLSFPVLLADWALARDLAGGCDPAQQARIACFARAILATRGEAVDEVLLAGHSLGSVFAVQALAQALRHDPGLLRRMPRLVLVGLGSSVLKVALMRGATALRADLALLARSEGFDWIEFASRRDVLSFERTGPLGPLGITGRGPVLESVHPRDMLDDATWRRTRWRFLRIHRQYVMGNGRRYFWDFGLAVCGPLPVGVVWPDRGLGPSGALGAAAIAKAAA
ncbi:hypothetical protein [Falsiroseomonas sp. HW251]|uniref:hypothetical protein n=1 Tax=Falsiroseomonas sp. HW251 TaxID=3390998 RepID=UPI003D31C0E1